MAKTAFSEGRQPHPRISIHLTPRPRQHADTPGEREASRLSRFLPAPKRPNERLCDSGSWHESLSQSRATLPHCRDTFGIIALQLLNLRGSWLPFLLTAFRAKSSVRSRRRWLRKRGGRFLFATFLCFLGKRRDRTRNI